MRNIETLTQFERFMDKLALESGWISVADHVNDGRFKASNRCDWKWTLLSAETQGTGPWNYTSAGVGNARVEGWVATATTSTPSEPNWDERCRCRRMHRTERRNEKIQGTLFTLPEDDTHSKQPYMSQKAPVSKESGIRPSGTEAGSDCKSRASLQESRIS